MRSTPAFLAAVIIPIALAVAGCAGHESPTEPAPVCTVTLSPATANFGPEGGSGSVTVTAPDGCPWSAATAQDWITITKGRTGTAVGPIEYGIAANTSPQARTGAVTLGDQTHTVTQAGRPSQPCAYLISPSTAETGKDAGTGMFDLSTANDCQWNATSDTPWLTLSGSSQGTGNARIEYSFGRNLESSTRTGTIAVADQRFSLRQSGDAGSCTYSVVPVAASPCMPAGTLRIAVTTQTFCPWSAAPDQPWLDVRSGTSGSGAGEVTVAYSENYGVPREGVIMLRWPAVTAGQNVHVAQAGCRYAVSRSEFGFTATAASASFDVLQQSDPIACGGPLQDRCVWTARPDVPWITIATAMPRSGDDRVSFAVAANDTPAARVGRITVQDKVVVVTQAGR